MVCIAFQSGTSLYGPVFFLRHPDMAIVDGLELALLILYTCVTPQAIALVPLILSCPFTGVIAAMPPLSAAFVLQSRDGAAVVCARGLAGPTHLLGKWLQPSGRRDHCLLVVRVRRCLLSIGAGPKISQFQHRCHALGDNRISDET